jgi:hypothetical protein
MDRAVQVMIETHERRQARRRAAEQGLTLSEYVARLIRADLETWAPDDDAPAIMQVDAENPPDHQGMYIGEAVAERMKETREPSA